MINLRNYMGTFTKHFLMKEGFKNLHKNLNNNFNEKFNKGNNLSI